MFYNIEFVKGYVSIIVLPATLSKSQLTRLETSGMCDDLWLLL